jgi:hypothetical protein
VVWHDVESYTSQTHKKPIAFPQKCENLFCPLTIIDVKPISARWGINFAI